MTIFRGLAILFVSCATALAAGCGSGESEPALSKDEYVKEFTALGGDLESTLNELDGTDFKNVKDIAQAADRIGNELDRIGTRASNLNPPEEIGQAHDNLATAILEFGTWFHDLAEAIRTTPRSDLERKLEDDFAFQGLAGVDVSKIAAAQKLKKAVDELNDGGYSFAKDSGQYEISGPGDAEAGKEVFTSADCGLCHTLADAGATGVVGPSLDDARPPYGLVIERVRDGEGIMPAFAGQLNERELQDVAAYVSQAAGG